MQELQDCFMEIIREDNCYLNNSLITKVAISMQKIIIVNNFNYQQ
jgi:hypothetical protein